MSVKSVTPKFDKVTETEKLQVRAFLIDYNNLVSKHNFTIIGIVKNETLGLYALNLDNNKLVAGLTTEGWKIIE